MSQTHLEYIAVEKTDEVIEALKKCGIDYYTICFKMMQMIENSILT